MIIKVCGMRNAENIRAVELSGADWQGFLFHLVLWVKGPIIFPPAQSAQVFL